MKTINRIAGALLVVVLLAFATGGCNTFRGVGKDIERGGEAIETTAEEVQQK